MRILLLFILAVTTCVVAIGQEKRFTVSGYIREAGTDEPLSGVSINSSLSNTSGYYSLKFSAGKQLLNCSMVGYQSLEIELNIEQDTLLNIALSPQEIAIGEVVVTAKSSTVSNKGVGRIGVNMQQLKYAPAFFGEQDIIKYLQIMPGVTSGKEGSSQLAVRGGGGDQTLILLDDIPIYNQNHAFGFVSIFNGDALSSAELYKGYVPAAFGGRLSSVVSLKMRDGNKYEHHQSLTVGTVSLSALLEGPIVKGKGSYIVSARRFTPDLLLHAFWAIRQNEDFKVMYSFYDINAKINYDLNKNNTLFASFYNGRDKFSNDYFSNYDNPFSGKKEREIESGHGFKWGNISGSLRLNTILGNDIFMNNSVYYSGLTNNQKSYVDDFKSENYNHSNIDSDISEIGFRSTIEQKVGNIQSFTYGLSGSMQIFTPQTTTLLKNGIATKKHFDNRTLYTATAFVEDEISVGLFKFNAGLRFSLFHNTTKPMIAIEPRAAVRYQPNIKNDLWLSYNRSTQPLFSVSKMFLNFPLDFWLPYTGSRLESSDQISVGWKTQVRSNLIFTLESYYKKFNNLTYIESLDDYLMDQDDALPATGKSYGIEFMAQYNLRRFSVVGAYTYSRSLRTVNGVTFPYTYDIPHNINIFASYVTLQKADRTHTLSINVNWRSGMPFTLSNTIYPNPDNLPLPEWGNGIVDNWPFPNSRLKPYFRTDLNFSMERKKRNGTRTWQISLINATNHVNPYLIYRDGDNYRYSTIMPIMPSFSYRRTF